MTRFLNRCGHGAALSAAAMMASPAWAQVQEAAPSQVLSDSGDNGWILAAAAIGLLALLPGTALLTAGRLHAGERGRGIALTLIAAGAAILLWVLIGYSLTFAPGTPWLGGFGNAFLGNMGEIRTQSTVHELNFALFQMVFAMTGAALVMGAVAERARPIWAGLFALVWVLLVYGPLTRWTSAGWLAQLGAEDFAGGFAVHIAAGVSALIVAMILGRRSEVPTGPVPGAGDGWIAMAGAALTLVGLVALAGGAALGAGPIAAAAMFNTLIGAAASGLLWVLARRSGEDSQSLRVAMGMVAGAAAVAPAAGLVSTLGALAIGVIAGIASRAALSLVQRRLRIDDLGGVFAVHGVAAMVGALLLAVFLSADLGGVGYAEGMDMSRQLVAQIVTTGVTIIWATVGTVIAAYGVLVSARRKD